MRRPPFSWLAPCSILFLAIAPILGGYFDQYDELFVASLALIGLAKNTIAQKDDRSISILLGGYILLGLISNTFSNLTSNYASIAIDLFTSIKHIIAFLFIKTVFSTETKNEIVRRLFPIAKLYIIATAVFAVISQAAPSNLTGEIRYGIRSFRFIYEFHIPFGCTVIAASLIIAAKSTRPETRITYAIIALIPLVCTTKGVVYIYIATLATQFLFVSQRRLQIRHYLVIVAILIPVLSYQIDNYLLKSQSPRIQFIITANDVAIDYFPLGSGFATFGGEQARIHYSKLYYKYGFHNRWGMAPIIPGESKTPGQFLNDNYIPMILAQTGFIGIILYLAAVLILFRQASADPFQNRETKFIATSALLMLLISSLGTATIKSFAGALLFSVIGILTSSGTNTEQPKNTLGNPLA